MQQGPGKLVICPTPIGNLADMPPRALDALRAAGTVCAEDTRVTGKLLASFGISAHLERLDENMLDKRARALLDRVAAGETIAYCSDAGMPGVSDPGQRLVALARARGVPLEVLPGPTAVATAYVNSGFSCPRFYFGGFFPRKNAQRSAVLESLADLDAVLLFYESPHRLLEALRCIAKVLPFRQMAVCRELTKLHEEVALGTADELARRFEERQANGGIKGEIVLVLDAPAAQEQQVQAERALRDAEILAGELAAQGLRGKQIAKQLEQDCGLSRNQAYGLALAAAKAANGGS